MNLTSEKFSALRTLQESKHKNYFEDEEMDFLFAWLLGYSACGGAQYGEIMYVASQIEDGNPQNCKGVRLDDAGLPCPSLSVRRSPFTTLREKGDQKGAT